MTHDHIEDMLSYARSMMSDCISIVSGSGSKLSSLLIAGNGGALGLIMKAGFDGTTCSAAYLDNAARPFALGLVVAFLGAALSWTGSMYQVGRLGRMIALLSEIMLTQRQIAEAEKKAVLAEDSPLRQKMADSVGMLPTGSERDHFGAFAFWIALLLFVTSAVAFITGVEKPLHQEMRCPMPESTNVAPPKPVR